ncbi:MAG: hypothetical protein JO069_00730 [Verrucomicrobia bacterium]|nr:hypothetical protein [Verrucomicrobiota bacterium]
MTCSAAAVRGQIIGQIPLSDTAQEFSRELAAKVQTLEQESATVLAGADGWLFLASELRLLSVGRFWGEDAIRVSHAPKPEFADPFPAIVDFYQQLKARGITLLLVPVPPKAAVYPEKVVPGPAVSEDVTSPFLDRFYNKLRATGIDVLDLGPLFLKHRTGEHGEVFCRTDTHWSGFGCVLAAQAIAERVRSNLREAEATPKAYVPQWTDSAIEGDLSGLLGRNAPKPGLENVSVRTVREQATGAPVQPDPGSPVLLLGDSFTLVFHDFLAERAGLLDQLALELGFAPDLIGTRGSGATPVRISLYRRSAKAPDYLARKRMIVWCFTAREFTEAAQGWQKLPVAR